MGNPVQNKSVVVKYNSAVVRCGSVAGPPVKCGFADLRIFKRVKCRWFCDFFCGRDG